MCLYIDKENTKRFLRNAPKIVTVYKLIKHLNGRWITPFRDIEIKRGIWMYSDKRWYHSITNAISGKVNHAIHVYKDIESARISAILWNVEGYAILKCKALKSDFIACDSYNELTFKKIFLPKKVFIGTIDIAFSSQKYGVL